MHGRIQNLYQMRSLSTQQNIIKYTTSTSARSGASSLQSVQEAVMMPELP